jgi:hypothetical protein
MCSVVLIMWHAPEVFSTFNLKSGNNCFKVLFPASSVFVHFVWWRNMAELLTLLHRNNVAARPGPVLVAQPGYCIIQEIWC